MKLKEYIESGVLEEFCLGLLPLDKARQVYLLSLKYPQIHSELIKIQETLLRLDMDASVKPPMQIKHNLMKKTGTIISHHDTYDGFSLNKFLIAASISMVIIFLGSIMYFSTIVNDPEVAAAELNNELSDTTKATFGQSSGEAEYYNLKKIILNGLKPDENSLAVAFISDEKVLLNISQLPIPPEGMQYQFWAIVGDQPVSVGLIPINHDTNKFIEFERFCGTKAIAISLEPYGGKEQPTSAMIKVIGYI